MLGIGLSLSNVASGIGGGLARIPVDVGTVTAFIVNFVFLDLGERLGAAFSGALRPEYMEIMAGFLLSSLGLSYLSEAMGS